MPVFLQKKKRSYPARIFVNLRSYKKFSTLDKCRQPPSSQSVRMTRPMRSNNPDFVWVASTNIANDTFDLSRHKWCSQCAGLEMTSRIWVCQILGKWLVGESLVGQESTPPLSQRDAELFSRRSRQMIPRADFYEILCGPWKLHNLILFQQVK